MVARHPLQMLTSSSCALPRRTRCHNLLPAQMSDRTWLNPQTYRANQRLKMPIGQKRTRCLEHLDLGSNQPVRLHPDQPLELHHLVHTKPEFCDPTTTDVKYTSRACCRPIQSNAEQELRVQSLPHRCALQLLMPLPLVLPLQTTA